MKYAFRCFAAGIGVILFLCSRDFPVQTDQTVAVYPGPGKFSLSHVRGLAKTDAAASAAGEGRAGFDLGSVGGSASFYFLLYNVGFSPITGISIGFADSQFAVSPARMDTLFPGIDIGLLPIVKVSAVHGTALTGVGYRPLLPMGNDTAVLTIKGTTRTKDGRDSVLVLAAGMAVKALVMDIDVRDANGSLPLASPGGKIRGDFPEGMTEMPFYSVSGCSVEIKNTGNVPVTATLWTEHADAGDTTWAETLSATIGPGRTTATPRLGGRCVVAVDGNNTVSDQTKLPLLPNGKCYFCLKGDASCDRSRDTSVQLEPLLGMYYAVISSCSNVKCRFFLIDDTYVFWELAGGKETCRYVTTGGVLYRLYAKSPDALLASYQREENSYWTIEHYESKAYHAMLDTIRANLSADDLGLGGAHTVRLIIQ
jgi:hypothetical protein